MLHIDLDLLPFGDSERLRTLAAIDIGNDGTGDDRHGNYDIVITDNSGTTKFRIENWDRNQSAIALLGEAINRYQKNHVQNNKICGGKRHDKKRR